MAFALAPASAGMAGLARLANVGLDPATNEASINRGIALKDQRASRLEPHDELTSETWCAQLHAAEHNAAAHFLPCLRYVPM